METENSGIKTTGKRIKKVFLIILAVVLVIGVAAGGFFVFKYFFPSDKELFFIGNGKLFSSDDVELEKYTKDTKLSFEFKGDFTSKKAVETVKSISVSTKNTHFTEDKSVFDFNMHFLNSEFLTFNTTKNADTEILTIPKLADKSYASGDAEEVLSMLLGSDAAARDIDILDGVDKERFQEFSKYYFAKLYDNIPNEAFVSTEDNGKKIITFKDNLNRMLYDIANEIKDDNELRDFLYEQTSIIYNNINAKFPYAGTLMTTPTKSEYEEDYNESISEFIKNIENSEITSTSHIIDKNILYENILITDDGVPSIEITYDNGAVKYIQYKEDREHIHFETSKNIEGTKTQKNTVIAVDVNEWTKEKIQGQKIVSVIIDSTLDTNVTEKYSMPEEFVHIDTLTDNEKIKIQESVNKNVTELLTSFTLALLFLQ